MSNDDRTDRFRPVFEPEDIFDRFVKNANASTEAKVPRDDEPTGLVSSGEARAIPAEDPRQKDRRGGPPAWDHEVTVTAPAPLDRDEPTRPSAPLREVSRSRELDDPPEVDEDALTVAKASPLLVSGQETQAGMLTESGQRVLLLTKKKPPTMPPPPAKPWAAEPWESVVAPKGKNTQMLEAKKLVPDVGLGIRRENTFINEGGEDGQMPPRELDRILSDMAVLLRYGHAGQVKERLDELRRTYPEDLLLLRAIAEFHVEHDQMESALETLFALAGGLFERRNVEGMRQALAQVLVLDPGNARALRLLSLLEQRAEEPARK